MSARIVVQTGLSAKKQFTVQESVLRLGSDPSCEIVLSDTGVAPHAATLEYRDGEYIVHNRSGGVIRLEKVPLQGRAFRAWLPGQDLFLNDQVALRLEVDSEPAVQPTPPAPATLPPASGSVQPRPLARPPVEPKAEDSRKRNLQYLVLAIVAVLGAALLLYDPDKKASSAHAGGTEFAGLIRELSQTRKDAQDPVEPLQYVLQEARIAQMRGDYPAARELYGQVVEMLLPRRSANGEFTNDLDRHVWAFVMQQLKGLS